MPLPLDLAATGRWILGHQTFHVQLVVMLTLLDRCQESLRRDDWPRLVGALADLRVLFDATTANMIYASSFAPALYTHAVRPSMMPPHLSPGFSGQLSHEHHTLLEDFAKLKQALQGRWSDGGQWPADVAAAWRQVGEAISRNRRHHGRVCQRFVPGGSSLLHQFLDKKGRAPESPADSADPANPANPANIEPQDPTHGDPQ